MKKFSEAVLAKHKHMALKASPYHPHSQGLVYTPKGKEEVRPIDTADAGYGGEAVSDAEGGDANPGIASKKAVSPMPMQTLVKPGLDKAKKVKEGFDPSPADIAKDLVKKHGRNVTKDHIKALEQDRDSHSGLDHDEIMKHVKKLQEETERERLMKLRQFAAKNRKEGLGKAMVEEEQIDELSKSTLASYAKKATDDVSYHSFTAGTMSSKDPERLVQDKKAMKRQSGVIKAVNRLAKEEAEVVGEATGVTNYNPKSHGGTRVELLQKLAKSKSPEHATAARKAGATQGELKKAMASEEYQVVAHTKTGEKFKSGLYPTKDKAQSMHYKLAKSGEHKNIKLVKVSEENDGTEADAGEYGYEGDMAMTQLKSIIRNAKELHDHMQPQTDLPEWLQSKITLAADYIQTAADYWKSEKEEAMTEGRMKDIATNKAEDERLAAQDVLGGPVKSKSSAIGGPGQPKSARNLAKRLATKAMKAGHSVSEEVWDKPMPDSKKQGSLSPEQKAKAKARAARAGRSYPNMIDNMWASKQ